MQTTPERQLESFLDKFDAGNAALIRSIRQALRKRLPTANELVYDNYNFLVIGYCSTEKSSDCILSIAADMHGVQLMFYWGATLPDPHGLLRGSGVQNRSLKVSEAMDLAKPEVEALLAAAVAQGKHPLPATGAGKLVIRLISEKQRPRRKAPATAKKADRRPRSTR